MFTEGQTVTVLRRAAPVFPTMGDYPAPDSSTDVKGCAIWPTTSTETVNGQDTVVWGLTVLLPVGTDVLATDQVAFKGITYDVNGQPFTWHSPMTGHEPGVEVQLRAATG